MKGAVRGVFTVLTIAGFLLFASFRFEGRGGVGPVQRTERHAFGLWFSPWFESVREVERVERPGGGWDERQTVRRQVLWLSWSWPMLAGAFACAAAAFRLRPRTPEAR